MNKKTICFMNNKGGVGKSTSAGNFASILSEYGKKILLVDCDPQGNCSQLFRMYRSTPKTIIDIFLLPSQNVQKESVQESIYETEIPGVHIIPSNEDFTFTCDDITRDNTRIQQLILKKALLTVKDDYDFIIIDNSPFFNIISINALCAADYVITPVESDGFGYKGLVQLLKKIDGIKSELNNGLEFLGVFINKLQITTNIGRDLYKSYQEEINENFIPIYIRLDNQVKESSTAFVPLTVYNAKAPALKDYKKLIADLHILDAGTQTQLVSDIKPIYLQEIHDLEYRLEQIKSSRTINKNTPVNFQLNILKSNLKRLHHS